MFRTIWFVVIALVAITAVGKSETIELTDGRKITCTIQSADSREIKIKTASGVETIPVSSVQSISMSDQTTSAPATAAPQESANSIPSGTRISIRTIDTIDSQGADLNRDYAANVDEGVVVNGVTLIPRGADAVLRVTEARASGRFTGRASLSLQLIAVVVNGQRLNVQTGHATSTSKSQGGKTARNTAIGAGIGAAAGAIFGGGRGAAIGAAAGGAGGAATAALSGQHVRVPAETRLTFTVQ